jgi:Ca2+-transporting ATPase
MAVGERPGGTELRSKIPAWHAMQTEEVLAVLGSRDGGLEPAEVARRQQQFGPNVLVEGTKEPAWRVLLAQFRGLLVLILVLAALASIGLGKYVEASAILVIVVLAGILGFIQEHQAGKAIEALKRMAAPVATLLRAGREVVVPSTELVPGDIVVLKAGDRIPADLRICLVASLKLDEAALTGESLPVEKTAERLESGDLPLGDRVNMAYMGTSVVYGRGTGLVVGTGMSTEFGRIAEGLSSAGREQTPLQKNLDELGKRLGVVAIVLAVVMSLFEILHGAPLAEIFVWGVALAVAVIPEALPAVVTITLALGVRRMVTRRALIRKLPAVETLGATSVICSDKTGTLTQDEMTVRQVLVGGKLFAVEGAGYGPDGEFRLAGERIDPAADPDLRRFLMYGVLCNDATLVAQDGVWDVQGDPTEGALLVAAAKAGFQKDALQSAHPRVHEIPFSSDTKRMTTVNRVGGGFVAISKGAPEVILASCATMLRGSEEVPLTSELRDELSEQAHRMADAALRVLALGSTAAHDDVREAEALERGLTFLGFAGMMDPPRPEAREAIRVCRGAGITPIMITGDHKVTAVAVARELGILEDGRALAGVELDRMSEEEFERSVETTRVYARISPSHKLKIVDALMRRGEIVAMTGDGVNDAPALKRANIGVAMGITGTEVSKEASDMVLTDDNFASIVAAVEEGRSIFENIRKYLVYLLSGNMGTVLGMLLVLAMSLPVPLTAVQILFINFLMDGVIAIALGVEPPERGIMRHPPRDVKSGILGVAEVIYIGGVGFWIALVNSLYFLWEQSRGAPVQESMTMFFVALLAARMVNSLNSRSLTDSVFSMSLFGNRVLLGALAIVALAVVAVVYLPPLQVVFKTYPLDAAEWLLVGGLAVSVLAYGEIHKAIRRSRGGGGGRT